MKLQDKGKVEMGVGLGLVLVGILGLIFGRSKKGFAARLMAVFSILSIVAGAYVFALGLDDYAMGIMGQMRLADGETPQVTEMIARSPADLKARLKVSFANSERAAAPLSIRRLHFQCPDGEKMATIYNTPVGVFGVPSHSLVCKDGFKLLVYDPRGYAGKEDNDAR